MTVSNRDCSRWLTVECRLLLVPFSLCLSSCQYAMTSSVSFDLSGGCRCTLTPVLGSPSEWPESSLLPGDNLGADRDGRPATLRAPFASSSHLHSNTCPANLALVAYDADCAAGECSRFGKKYQPSDLSLISHFHSHVRSDEVLLCNTTYIL